MWSRRRCRDHQGRPHKAASRAKAVRAQQASIARTDMLCRDLLADCQVDSSGGSSHKASIASRVLFGPDCWLDCGLRAAPRGSHGLHDIGERTTGEYE